MSRAFILLLIISNIYEIKLTQQSAQYIINSDKCKLANLQPFNEEVIFITKPENYSACTNLDLLSYVSKVNNSATLRIKEELIHLYTNSTNNLDCCYSNITRSGTPEEPDVGINISNCEKFQNNLKLHHDTVKIQCKSGDELIYENVHNSVLLTDSVKIKKKISRKFNENVKPFSVLFVVVDSISRLNFMRTMSKTYEFLKINEFIEMKGYSKVDDATFPNAMALLTGLTLKQTRTLCNPEELNKLDECPMIWYDYRNLGYVTGYGEDFTRIATFNYRNKGFTNPPTDYYFKPYMEGAETLESINTKLPHYCAGPETSGERILNLAKDFSKTFVNHPNFGIFWMNTFSHEDVNTPYGFDEKIKEFFVDLKDYSVLNDSIVIVLSDHGIRFGDIHLTLSGWLETRLPINMISIPERFRRKFPTEYENIKENANKFTNTFDMYMTLQHILTLSGFNYQIKQSLGCPKCKSLFEKIPSNRSCKDASVPEKWCTCFGNLRKIDLHHEYVRVGIDIFKRKLGTMKDVHVFTAGLSEKIPNTNIKFLIVVFELRNNGSYVGTIKFNAAINQDYSSLELYKILRLQHHFF